MINFEDIITEIENGIKNQTKEDLVFIKISDETENRVLKRDNKIIEIKNRKGILIWWVWQDFHIP